MPTVRCALSNDPQFRATVIELGPNACVAELKEAIRAENLNNLSHLSPYQLTLVRVRKADSGGLSADELQQAKELLIREAYGVYAEGDEDVISMYRDVQGACRVKDGLFFKVMNTMEDACVYLDSTPEDMYHVVALVPVGAGAPNRNDMDIDPLVMDLCKYMDDVSAGKQALDKAINQLSAFIRIKHENSIKRNVFSADESLDNVNQFPPAESSDTTCHSTAATKPMHRASQPRNLLKLDIPTLNKIPSFLSCGQIYHDERSIGINMPVDKLLNVKQDTIILIGVSGCGKTRTCYDFARHQWCLYFDCALDSAVHFMTSALEDVAPRSKSLKRQQEFERTSEKYLMYLMSARMLVLKLWRQENLDPFKWLCIQRSRRTQPLLQAVFTEFTNYTMPMVSAIFSELRSQTDDCWVIFDESQRLLDILPSSYRSFNWEKRGISRNKLMHPRSFYSFATAYLISQRIRSICCGTKMEIACIEGVSPSAGLKPPTYYTFTDFNFLTASQIFRLCGMWLQEDVFNKNRTLLEETSTFLQGRPRFFMSFLDKLNELQDIKMAYETYRLGQTTTVS
ncbi:hypothetical protein HDU81_006300 [Chytriomyces hyalinus]|nr:hypothetical protein HDU81_006300 [Chytriomyces hyalinus]